MLLWRKKKTQNNPDAQYEVCNNVTCEQFSCSWCWVTDEGASGGWGNQTHLSFVQMKAIAKRSVSVSLFSKNASVILGNQVLRSFLKLPFPFVQWIKTQTDLTWEMKRLNSLFIKSKISFNSCYIIPRRSTFTSWGLLVDPWLTHTALLNSREVTGRNRVFEFGSEPEGVWRATDWIRPRGWGDWRRRGAALCSASCCCCCALNSASRTDVSKTGHKLTNNASEREKHLFYQTINVVMWLKAPLLWWAACWTVFTFTLPQFTP